MHRQVILTDIEGTTSSISFVRDVLFPFARRELPGFVRDQHALPEVRHELDTTAVELGIDRADFESLISKLVGFIDEDRKFGPLKTLQGLIWKRGYENGELVAHVYQDAVVALRR